MICYKVIHRHRVLNHPETKAIGIYSSLCNAEAAMAALKTKAGFRETAHGFRIKRVFRLFKPKLLDKTFWIDGFTTYTY